MMSKYKLWSFLIKYRIGTTKAKKSTFFKYGGGYHKEQKRLILDRKDQKLINYYNNNIAVDKKITKSRMKEFICKRYNE